MLFYAYLNSNKQTFDHFHFRASLQNVFFPSITLCNINQGRSSLFHAYGLAKNKTLLNAVLQQAYFGSKKNLSESMVSSNLTDKLTLFSLMSQKIIENPI